MELTTLLLFVFMGCFVKYIQLQSRANSLESKANHLEGLSEDYENMLKLERYKDLLEEDGSQ
jgi:hypothetical protein